MKSNQNEMFQVEIKHAGLNCVRAGELMADIPKSSSAPISCHSSSWLCSVPAEGQNMANSFGEALQVPMLHVA